MKYDHIESSVYGKISNKEFGETKEVNENEPFVDLIDNYYMTDAISRNSVTMAKCSTAFNPVKHTNFKKIRQNYSAWLWIINLIDTLIKKIYKIYFDNNLTKSINIQ